MQTIYDEEEAAAAVQQLLLKHCQQYGHEDRTVTDEDGTLVLYCPRCSTYLEKAAATDE